jgi:hypothetical protein
MTAIVTWYEMIVGSIPLPLLEVLGRFSYIVGLFLAFCAFGGFTFRIGEHWGFGRARQTWNVHAFLSVPLTFVLIIASGYIGSFIVLVPGAQTFESLKDLVVLLSVVLLGYPALITIPFAYGVLDLIEGVPPDFLLAWLPGYFINPAYFWIAYQFIGKNPDFRMGRTWWRYLIAAVLFMALEPVLWGYVCSEQFPSGISYHSLTPALFFTTSLTWVMGPWPFWPRCRWPDGSDGSGRRSLDTSENARLGAANGSGNQAVARRGAAPRRCRRACQSGSSSSRRSSLCCS